MLAYKFIENLCYDIADVHSYPVPMQDKATDESFSDDDDSDPSSQWSAPAFDPELEKTLSRYFILLSVLFCFHFHPSMYV